MQILRTTERSEGIADYMAFRYDSANIPGLCVLLEEGQTVRDTYEVERFLGGGAFAEVYRVKHRFLGRQAMKVFKRVGMNLEEIHEMLGEAILLSRIGHPNIVRVFDANVLEAAQGNLRVLHYGKYPRRSCSGRATIGRGASKRPTG